MSKKEELESKIIEAAVGEFLARGYDSGSMENIAKLAEVSKRTLYKYYPNKEAVFDAIIEKLLLGVCSSSPAAYSKSESIEEQLSKIIDYKSALMTSPDYVDISRLVLSEIIKGRKLAPNHLERFSVSEQHFIKWIDAAKKDGKIASKQSSELIANQFHSIFKGQIFYPVIFGFKELSKNDVKTAKKIALEFFINSFCK